MEAGRNAKIRKKPDSWVTVLDFTSMYPTMTLLLGIWQFIIADDVEIQDVSGEVRALLASVDLSYLQHPDHWKDFAVLVKTGPDDDILPVRMDYKGDGLVFNVGINYLTSDIPLWYALPDVIAQRS